MRTASKTDVYKMEGVGASKNMAAAVLPSLRLTGGRVPRGSQPGGSLVVEHVREQQVLGGNLGIDLLQQARKTIFDFKEMRLTLQSSRSFLLRKSRPDGSKKFCRLEVVRYCEHHDRQKCFILPTIWKPAAATSDNTFRLAKCAKN